MNERNDVGNSAKCLVEKERDYYRRKQGEKAAAVAGPLLDAWESLPNDVKCAPELSEVASRLCDLEEAMDPECWPDDEEFNAEAVGGSPDQRIVKTEILNGE